MPKTKKKYHGKKHKTQRKSKTTAGASTTFEKIKQNRMRNKMIRNIRMGRVHRGGGGGGEFISQFIGKPWTPDSIGRNYFAPSPNGVGTGVVPKFDAGQPLGNARYPTQLGPQLAKLGQNGGGSRKKSKKNSSRRNVSGGGIIGDLGNMVDNVKYSFGKLNTTLAGENPPPNPNPYNQPISKNMI
jgi:hypothetical protein